MTSPKGYQQLATDALAEQREDHESRMRAIGILAKQGLVTDFVSASPSGKALMEDLRRLGDSYAAQVATTEGEGKHVRKCRDQASRVVADIAFGK